jgi:hypothetical protein
LLREAAGDKSLFAKSSGYFPKRWRSLTTDTPRTITISDDAMLVEVILPNELKPYRRDWSELRKTNDKWIGTWHSSGTCTYKQPFKIAPTQNSR